MNNDYDLYYELQAKQKQLSASLKELRVNGIQRAEKERDYKILLRQECLKFLNRTPNMIRCKQIWEY